MRKSCWRNTKILAGLTLAAITNLFILYSELNLELADREIISKPIRTKFEANEIDVKDWHDVNLSNMDALRIGPGEQGRAVPLDSFDTEKVQTAYGIYAYNTLASAHIALDRSLPDFRHPTCNKVKYLSKLPPASVIIVFHNEHWTVIIRTIRSVIDRSPPELIEEVILVDDASTVNDVTYLNQYVESHLPKTRIIHLRKRSGLIAARLVGAKVAIASILIFLDAHVEATYNWLAPLLEPIVKNNKTCICPQIDRIKYSTFEYEVPLQGSWGLFDWHFTFYRFSLLPGQQLQLPTPFRDPIMMGGLFAIGADFFEELGGYDEELDIWGSEQYELSFKIWMCGGQLLGTSCSRFGHIFPAPGKYHRNPRSHDYFRRNLKRVVEVWMDEYREYVYMRDPVYYQIDAGNLTKQHALRSKLNCKSFKLYLEEVAVELLKYFPAAYPSSYASGTIRNDNYPQLCIDAFELSYNTPIGLYECSRDLVHPHTKQHWFLTFKHELRVRDSNLCADAHEQTPNASVSLYECHGEEGNQFWQYDFANKWLKHKHGEKCLEANYDNKTVFLNICDTANLRLRWTFGAVNETAI